MGRPSALIEHLLRRAGFGATPAERDSYEGMDYYDVGQPVARLRSAGHRHRRQTRHAGLRRHHDGRAVPPQSVDQPGAAALAVPHGALAGAAAGKDGALLAPPLRDGVQQGLRRGRGHADATRMMDAKPSEDPGGRPGTDSAVPRHGARQLQRSARGGREGQRDARLARRAHQHQGQAAGELRPRADGAVHVRRGELRRDGRVRRGARLHGMESGDHGHGRARRRRTSRSTTSRPARHGAKRCSVSRSTTTGSKTHPGAVGELGHAGRHRSDQRAGRSSRHRPAPGAAAVDVVRERDRGARPGVRGPGRGRVPAQRHRHEGDRARGARLAAVHERRAASTSATRGPWSSSCAR